MPDDECFPGGDVIGWREVFMAFTIFLDAGQILIVLGVQGAVLVEQVVDALGGGIDEFNDFDVIGEVEFRNRRLESLFLQDIFLVFEDLIQVHLMNPFIGVVDAKLFEGIFLEHFEPIDIKHFDHSHIGLSLLGEVDLPVEFFHNPQE